jgi:hypothetical protein
MIDGLAVWIGPEAVVLTAAHAAQRPLLGGVGRGTGLGAGHREPARGPR